MRGGFIAMLGAATVVAAATGARGQFESHCVPAELPPALFPSWVQTLPPLGTHQVEPPAASARQAPSRVRIGADARQLLGLDDDANGSPQARSLDELAGKPRKVVDLARGGEWVEAADAGEAFLGAPGKYSDFTWDCVGNAAAWACIQIGDLKRAQAAHGRAASKIKDSDLRQYHQAAAGFLGTTEVPPERLKTYETYRKMFLKTRLKEVEALKTRAAHARTASTLAARLRQLETAYKMLRSLWAMDAELGKALAREDFVPAADALATEAAPALVGRGRHVVARLASLDKQLLQRSQWSTWNRAVRDLWATVRQTKRVCRMQTYLKRVGLAESPEAEKHFRAAHELLFAPKRPGTKKDQPRQVYKPIGGRAGPGLGTDARKRVPCAELNIQPM